MPAPSDGEASRANRPSHGVAQHGYWELAMGWTSTRKGVG